MKITNKKKERKKELEKEFILFFVDLLVIYRKDPLFFCIIVIFGVIIFDASLVGVTDFTFLSTT